MSADDWRELLDDPEIEGVIRRVLHKHGRPRYTHHPLAYDDLESWIWDEAVRVAEAYGGAPANAPDPRRHWHAILFMDLRKAIVQGWHFNAFYGKTGGARRAATENMARFSPTIPSDVHFIEANTRNDGALGFHKASHDEPLGHVLRMERLDRILTRAETLPADYTTETSPYCSENLCLSPVVTRGLCQKHYQRERAHDAPTCTVDGCTAAERHGGLCITHYNARRREDPTRPACSDPDCERRAVTRGYCSTHYDQAKKVHGEQWAAERAARAATTTCTTPDCQRTGRIRAGLCDYHYRRRNKEAA